MVESLKRRLAAFNAQSKLLEHFLTLAHSSAAEPVLHSILQETLQVSVDLVAADKGSLFLLDGEGRVTDGILTRGDRAPEERAGILAKVMTTGLAAWVCRNRTSGLVIDTLTDPRWLDLPNQPYQVRSALSVPILRGGDLLGLVTLLHPEPGRFTTETAELMEMTATLIGVALENARLYTMLQTYSRALDAEMEKGRRIQQQFLPASLPQPPGWDIAAAFYPARKVSGDFYDAYPLSNGRLCVVIGDVCDKGVGPALFMAVIRSLVRVLSGKFEPGAEAERSCSLEEADMLTAMSAVSRTNDYLTAEHADDGMFASLFFGVICTEDGRMAYVNAGHEPGLIVAPSGLRAKLAVTGPAVGALPHARFVVKTAVLDPGDTLLLYSDGATDALSPGGDAFGRTRLESSVCRPAKSAAKLLRALKRELFDHAQDAPRYDDITLLALRRAG
jgi:sigma-B regulation protein RsbU (phosphoserine phosphatase)